MAYTQLADSIKRDFKEDYKMKKIKLNTLIIKLSAILFLCFCSVNCFAYYPAANGENYLQITQIERSLFNRSYENEDIYSRLNRIEQRLFRSTNTSASLCDRLEAIMSNINPSMLANIPIKELSLMERQILRRAYTNETPDKRIERLEQALFGTIQPGNLEARFQKLQLAINSQQQYSASYSALGIPANRTPRNTLQNLLGGIGTITGFTPPVYDNFSTHPNDFHAGSYAYNNFYKNNTSLHNTLRNYATAGNVRILE